MDQIEIEIIRKEISRWMSSKQRRSQLDGVRYYNGRHDILMRKREAIGQDGKPTEITNLPNNKVVDNQFKKLVDQKVNYLLGKPFVFEGDDKEYIKKIKSVFGKKVRRMMKNACRETLLCGICWLFPYYSSSTGEFLFKLFPGCDVLPFWEDDEHTHVKRAVRLYNEKIYEGTEPKIIEKAEVYDSDGVWVFTLDGGTLKPDPGSPYPYAHLGETALNWQRIPLIPIKYNDETPLLENVRSLQDGINLMISDFENNLQEDARNTIIVLKNYDGENLGEFRRNLATYGAVKVRSDGESRGGVDTLQVTVNADNYKAILDIFKKAIIENGKGFDSKSDRLGTNPNQMNIQSMYSDIDLDANGMETEMQASFDDMLWFVNCHLANTGKGNYFDEPVDIIFNRDILINESQVIEDIKNSVGILSKKTLVAQHPYVDDIEEELKRIKEEEQEEYMDYNAFGDK
jgi:SPP1 family phage portal protein